MVIPSKNLDNSWSFSTNWAIYGGSPFSAVNCVSSSESQTLSGESPDTTERRTPLILKASSKVSASCYIKLNFTQRHKIKKIYVRSTARTYEVHYTSALESNDVNLCAVVCDMASREEDVLHASDNKENREAISETSKVSNKEPESESDNDSTKDEWVDLGIPASSPDQDFYEVATETIDVDPCISVKLRLLSPHIKDLIHIDEVRIFADAVEPSDSENKRSQEENSAESTLMTTLSPKLSQLSMSCVGCLKDEHSPSVVNEQGNGSEAPGLKETSSGAEPDGSCNTPDEPSPSQKREHNSDKEEKHAFPYGQVEKVLEQLLLRVCKIEDLFSIFEKNTLKPIINMEARLQKVEQYMELLAKNSKGPAPSMIESKLSAVLDSKSVNPLFSTSEFHNGLPASNTICKPADYKSKSIVGSQFVPSLVVTAPAFSCDEDDNEEDISLPKPPKVFSPMYEKKTSSVSDVLDPFSSFNIQSSDSPDGPDSPLMFFHPSSLQRGRVPVTSKIDGEEFGQPAEIRQKTLESILGGFGQARQLGTGIPKSGATPIQSFGFGFSGFESNGFSKIAAQGGSFGSQDSSAKGNLGAASSTFGSGYSAHETSFGVPTTDSGGRCSTCAIFGALTTSSGGGLSAPANIFGVPTTVSSGGLAGPENIFDVPTPASSGGLHVFGVPTTASSGGLSGPENIFGVPRIVSENIGVPTTASSGGLSAPENIFGVPTTVSSGGLFAPANRFCVPKTASGGGVSAPENIFGVPKTASGGLFAPASIFGGPMSDSKVGLSAPTNIFGVPTTASDGGFNGHATSFGAPATTFGEGFTAWGTSFGVPATASGEGFTVPATSFAAPMTASGGRFTSPATNVGVPGAAFGCGYNLSGGFGAASNQQASNAFSLLAKYGPTGIPSEVLTRARK